MKKGKALFLGFLIVLVGLFGLCGFSLIKCFVYGTAEEGESNVLEIIYLFLHLIMIAIVFYLTFRAFRIKSSIIRLMMLDDNEKKTAKTLIISGILSGLFYTIGSYFFNKDEEHAYFHAIWHVFIILGSAAHTAALWLVLAA